MGDRLATKDMGQKTAGLHVPLSGGGEGAGPHLTQCGLVTRSTSVPSVA